MPDMKKLYFVEVPKDDGWVYVHETDDAEDAVKVAKTYPRARVRQLPVQYQPARKDFPKDNGRPTPNEGELVLHQCIDHPHNEVKAYKGGQVPTCPDCGKNMMPHETVKALVAGPVLDWSGEVK